MKRSTLLIVFVLCSLISNRSYADDLGSNLMQRMEERGPVGNSSNHVGLVVPTSNDRSDVKPADDEHKSGSGRYSSLVAYQQKYIDSLSEDQLKRKSLVSIDKTAQQSTELDVHLLYNFFSLDSYQGIEAFFIDSGKKSELGEPLLRYIKYSDSLVYYVLSKRPTSDVHFDSRSNDCLIKQSYKLNDAIRFFDRTSEIFLYRLAGFNGVLLVRGNYVYLDENLNGVPESIYMIQRYKTANRKALFYLLPVQQGEKTIKGSSKAKLFTDALATVLDIIQTQYPAQS